MSREETPDGKLSQKYHAPFKVMSRSDNGSYTLFDVTNQTLARNYAPGKLKRVTQALDVPSDESYEVEAIVGHDFSREGVEYTVKWKGYDSSHNQRIPYRNFDSDTLIRQYWKRLKQSNPPGKKSSNEKSLDNTSFSGKRSFTTPIRLRAKEDQHLKGTLASCSHSNKQICLKGLKVL
ncbi:hypothetical protein KVV02_006662 [Mortierella alpina]|uniref:Chromo domain-containing protein n=1 Tax=Mortierella alpina TaxID=64518 RepID=A0A9P8A4Y9_MORAP|nr:hypothetical protein KVV02_006662 [Mortierella alpina]